MSLFKKKEKIDVSAPKVPEGNNPYLNARQEWLERYGTYLNRWNASREAMHNKSQRQGSVASSLRERIEAAWLKKD